MTNGINDAFAPFTAAGPYQEIIILEHKKWDRAIMLLVTPLFVLLYHVKMSAMRKTYSAGVALLETEQT